MPPSDHRVRGTWTHSGLSVSDSHPSRKLGVDPAYHPPIRLTKANDPIRQGPRQQNTESLALDQYFIQHLWTGRAPEGSHHPSPCLHHPLVSPFSKKHIPKFARSSNKHTQMHPMLILWKHYYYINIILYYNYIYIII